MKLATLADGTRDGRLMVVSRDLATMASAASAASTAGVAPTLQAVLEDWDRHLPALARITENLNRGTMEETLAVDPSHLMAPLPRAYQFVDGSAYLNHVELVRRARGAEMPPGFLDDPLIYQAVSDGFLGPAEDILCASEAWGIDFEAEVAVVTGDVPMGVDPVAARGHVRLVMLVNDVSLRGLIPGELAKGFGFLQGKPRSSFSPVAVTLDELGDAWADGKLHLPLVCHLNDREFGRPDAGTDMNFDFGRLIAHAAATRPLAAGTIVGSGTVSNRDRSVGSCCLAEVRTIETIDDGAPRTPFMAFGDRIRIEMFDTAGASIFGAIDQQVARCDDV